MEQEILQAELELGRPNPGLFLSGLVAGLTIGVSLFLIATMMTLADGVLPEAVTEILIANAYTVGFILVILGRTDLFTEYTTIAILPVLDGQATFASLARLWGLVYLGNLAGGSVFAGLVVIIGPELRAIEPAAFGKIARSLTDHSAWVILLSSVLAGWLMGLLSWLVVAARDTISQVFFVWLIAGSLGLGHLHHAIVGFVEVLAGVFSAQGVSFTDLGHFLLWTTLGNAAGGVLFAVLIRYSLVVGGTEQ